MKEFDPIIGYKAIKTELMQIADMMRNSSEYESLGVRLPHGLMLHGDPGVGKTLMANCLVEASGRRAFVCRKDQPQERFMSTIADTFREGAENAPSIVMLDDMDKFANSDDDHPYAEEYISVQSCIDQYKGRDVFVLATVNDIGKLPSSLKRAGRFDRIIEVPNPSIGDAKSILAHYLADKKAVDDIDTGILVRLMGGMSCASLETIINEAGVIAGYERSESIRMDHFIRACLNSMFAAPSHIDDLDMFEGMNSRELVVIHEAGHTVASEVLFPGSVTLTALNEREGKCGGITSCYHHDEEDIRWQKSRIVTALAGMAAVEQIRGVAGTGASSDLTRAYSLLKKKIESEAIAGFALFGYGYGNSERLDQSIEVATAAMLNGYYLKAKEILAANRGFLTAVIDRLSADGVLTVNDLASIEGECEIRSVDIG